MLFALGLYIFAAGAMLFLLSFLLLTSCLPDILDTIMPIIMSVGTVLMVIGILSVGFDMLTYLGIL